jgi:hypothetical protein
MAEREGQVETTAERTDRNRDNNQMNKMTVVFKSVNKTNLMQNAGMFERFKVIVEPVVTVDTTTPFTEFVRRMQSIQGPYSAPIAIRDNSTGEEWVDESVIVVSNGQNWALFTKFLNQHGFTHETSLPCANP